MRALDGRTLTVFARASHRKGKWHFFQPDEVPEFEGEGGWFEIEWVARRKWRVVRQVERSGPG
jgi:hypothetical protein